MLRHELRRSLRVGELALPLRGTHLCRGLTSARLLRFPRPLCALHLGPQRPSGAPREVGGGEVAALETLIFFRRRRREHALELPLAPLRAFGFVARRLDVPQRFRESAHLVVDVLLADSPERVERIFSRHDF